MQVGIQESISADDTKLKSDYHRGTGKIKGEDETAEEKLVRE